MLTRRRQALALQSPRARGPRVRLALAALTTALWGLLCDPPLAAAQSAALSVTVTDGVDVADPGRGLTLSVVARNAGPGNAAATQLMGSLAVTPAVAANTLTVYWRCSTTAPTPGIAVDPQPEVGRDDLSTTASLPAGGTLSCLVFVEVPRTGVTGLRYTAQVAASGAVTDPYPQDNEASDVTQVRSSADLQLSVRGVPSAPIAGQVLSFVVGARNIGPQTATNVRLDLDKPPGAHIDQAPRGDGWSCTEQTASFRCVRDQLPVYQISEVQIALLPDAAASRIALGATGAADESDPTPSDNAAVAELPIEWRDGKARLPTLSGGGFGCAISTSRARSAPGSGTAIGILTLILAGSALPRRRKNQQRKRGLPCDEFF